jgi:medium-chain acyl-[acyl-carrier-protein] hydrolase
MNKFVKEYPITNSLMNADFRLSPMGATMLWQDCFAMYMSRYHVAAFNIRELGKMWIINDFSLRFIGEQPFWGNTVKVELWISEEPAVKVHADFRIKINGQVVVEGDSSWAILDIDSRRPVPAHEILPKFDIIPEFGMDTHRHRFPACSEQYVTYRHITNSSDTDFNHHVSNVTYLRICFNSMPSEYLQTHTVKEFSIKFLHESFLGEELVCSVFKTDEQDLWNYSIADNGDKISGKAMIRYTEKI